jgi:hypothetical protein
MSGAQYLYNLMLAQAKNLYELASEYDALLEQWAEQLTSKAKIYSSWDRSAFWQRLRLVNPRMPEGVRLFSEAWMTSSLSTSNPKGLSQTQSARQLLENRESQLKGARARLKSQTHLDLWKGAAGAEPLNYRWGITKKVVDDIVAGLGRGKGGNGA